MGEVQDTTRAVRCYGAAARIGVIVPTTNTVNEAEWSRLVPEAVTFHSARMPLHEAGDSEGDALPRALSEALTRLTPANLTAIAYSCTAGSLVHPVESLPDAMTRATGLPCTSTAAAIVAALKHLRVSSVAVATPYHDALNDHEATFLESCGFAVTAIQGLGIGAGGPAEYTKIATLPLEAVETHARDAFARGPAGALLLSCTDLPTLPMLQRLEADLGVPVVTSNTATLWRTLQLAGVEARSPLGGRLLAGS